MFFHTYVFSYHDIITLSSLVNVATQDAVAVIKNELLQFLPGCEIFLDVDDLKNIGELEAYIRRSQVVLCFLSRGYLRSTNCLREVRAALEMGKPLVLVHEADPDKGGGTRIELRSECPEELQAAIFDASWPMVVWHRIEDFQHVSLKETKIVKP